MDLPQNKFQMDLPRRSKSFAHSLQLSKWEITDNKKCTSRTRSHTKLVKKHSMSNLMHKACDNIGRPCKLYNYCPYNTCRELLVLIFLPINPLKPQT
jgi:hypothetical protein